MSDTELEQLLDKRGLAAVLNAIAGICSDKADHIRSSYSDENLAFTWEQASIAVTNCANRAAVREVSQE